MTMEISAKIVKELRDKTGAGMMNCKKALTDNNGDFDKAMESLRLKGEAIADKKASRSANEGLIEAYIHTGSKLGILLEVNCETDFVSRKPEFKELAQNLGMQIAACPDIEVISLEQISSELKQKEWDFESSKDDLANKPEEIKNKIIEGRVAKRLKTKVLLEQDYIRDSSLTVDAYLKQKISLFGENIKIARFSRFTLGE
uniref:Multifunctional fusion protein n=1 Tax=Triparma laevis TaxID=1534972 RepID=A0A0K2RW31_9STRA|nr:translation elongation factor Ts [Triparma laevis]BAS19046.1 translation elongation factor Ts [Triparma laevis]